MKDRTIIISLCLQVFFASVRSGGSSQVFFMTLNRNSMMNWWWTGDQAPPPVTLLSPTGRHAWAHAGLSQAWARCHAWTLLCPRDGGRVEKSVIVVKIIGRCVRLEIVRSYRSHRSSTHWKSDAGNFPNIPPVCLSVCPSSSRVGSGDWSAPL